jgi:transposase
VTDPEWSLFGARHSAGETRRRRQSVNVREIVNGLLYLLSTGCQWRAIPRVLPAKSTLYDYLDLWNHDGTLSRIHHTLYIKSREQVKCGMSSTAAVIDSQSVTSAEKGCLDRLSWSDG